jgi:hypothetical protein
MRFMMLLKHAEKAVQGDKPVPPPQKLMDKLAELSEEAVKSGAMIANGALGPTAVSSRVRLSGGKVIIIDGPFAEGKEIVGGFAILDYRSKEEAVEGARQYMELYRQYWPDWEGETEVRPMFGQDDFIASTHNK